MNNDDDNDEGRASLFHLKQQLDSFLPLLPGWLDLTLSLIRWEGDDDDDHDDENDDIRKR